MGKNQAFPKSARIRKQSEFDLIYAADHFAADETLVIRGRRNGMTICRLGLSIGKPVGNAVIRNLWKRKIREAFRKQKHDLPAGLDIVVRPRKGATCDYEAIFRSLSSLAKRLDKKIPHPPTARIDSEPNPDGGHA